MHVSKGFFVSFAAMQEEGGGGGNSGEEAQRATYPRRRKALTVYAAYCVLHMRRMSPETEKEQEKVLAVAKAVEALSKLHHTETLKK